jgi:hypothetical protein
MGYQAASSDSGPEQHTAGDEARIHDQRFTARLNSLVKNLIETLCHKGTASAGPINFYKTNQASAPSIVHFMFSTLLRAFSPGCSVEP